MIKGDNDDALKQLLNEEGWKDALKKNFKLEKSEEKEMDDGKYGIELVGTLEELKERFGSYKINTQCNNCNNTEVKELPKGLSISRLRGKDVQCSYCEAGVMEA